MDAKIMIEYSILHAVLSHLCCYQIYFRGGKHILCCELWFVCPRQPLPSLGPIPGIMSWFFYWMNWVSYVAERRREWESIRIGVSGGVVNEFIKEFNGFAYEWNISYSERSTFTISYFQFQICLHCALTQDVRADFCMGRKRRTNTNHKLKRVWMERLS